MASAALPDGVSSSICSLIEIAPAGKAWKLVWHDEFDGDWLLAVARPDELVKLIFPAADARLLGIERTGLYRMAGENRLTPFDLLTNAAQPQEERRAIG